MRLVAELAPDAVDRRRAHARPGRHHPHAPVAPALGRWAHREHDQAVTVLAGVGRRVSRPRRIGEAREPRLRIPAAPQLNGHDRHAQLVGDASDRDALGRTEHDAGPGHRPLLAGRGTDHRLEQAAVAITDGNRRSRSMSHAPNRTERGDHPLDISGTGH